LHQQLGDAEEFPAWEDNEHRAAARDFASDFELSHGWEIRKIWRLRQFRRTFVASVVISDARLYMSTPLPGSDEGPVLGPQRGRHMLDAVARAFDELLAARKVKAYVDALA
jgi:hypothetical protein